MVVGFTTTHVIGDYHNCCEFESRSGLGVQHHVIKFVSAAGRWFSPPIKPKHVIKFVSAAGRWFSPPIKPKHFHKMIMMFTSPTSLFTFL